MQNFPTMSAADAECERLAGLGTPAAAKRANADGTVDVLMPSDVIAPTQAELDAAAAEQQIAEYTAKLESFYDKKAAERKYDSRFTCALRAGYVGPFQAEGAAFAVWMDNCNATAYAVMAEVLAGTRANPSFPELLALMPLLTWP